ncbi:hypothetical protein [Streptomyces sp. NPDC048410]|uniref:hypothetical protein n=1 Tax=Streptomyces sp. NPDC048410 TaxID=3365545 RepID=UPI00371613C8
MSARSQYVSAHRWVLIAKGPAKHKPCAFCGTFAHEWAYNHLDPAEVYRDGYLWSEDTAYYIALCKRDHLAYDRAFRKHGKAALPAVTDALRDAGRDRYDDAHRAFVDEQNHDSWRTREMGIGEQNIASPQVSADRVREVNARMSAAHARNAEG